MKTKRIIMKSRVRKAMALTGCCILSIFLASADFSNPDEGWKNSPSGISDVSPTSQNTILNQRERKPFGGDDAPQSILRANPGGNGQKQVPADGGILVIIGLAVAYGIACRKFRKDTR